LASFSLLVQVEQAGCAAAGTVSQSWTLQGMSDKPCQGGGAPRRLALGWPARHEPERGHDSTRMALRGELK